MDASKFWMRQVLLFGLPFLDSTKTYGTLPKTYDLLKLIGNIYYNHFHTFIMFIFCMYMHIFMSIFYV